jgi:hypothetical protein
MEIRLVVEEVLRTGWMKLVHESALARFVGTEEKFSAAEFKALLHLQKALRTGEVMVGERKRCVNAMEQLVRDAIVDEMGRREIDETMAPDLGDVAAYALNRLPSLYATTRQGYQYHLEHLDQDLQSAIRERVRGALDKVIEVPVSRPDGQPSRGSPAADAVGELVTAASGPNEKN